MKSNPGQTNAKVLLFCESGAVGPKCPSLKEAPQPPKNIVRNPCVSSSAFLDYPIPMVLDVDTGGVPEHSRAMICEVKPAKPNTERPALIQLLETISGGSLVTPCRWVIASLLFIAASVLAADNDHWDDQFGAPGVDQIGRASCRERV